MPEVVLYRAKEGHIQLDVNVTAETVWLSLKQLCELFGRDKSVISRHIKNIFKINELDNNQTVAKFATVQKEGQKKVQREVEYYNLDVRLGYQVHSKEAIFFRQWATKVLKDHLIRGYTIYEKRFVERGIKELQQTVDLLQQTLSNHKLVSDVGLETIQLIIGCTKTWHLLLAYDEDRLELPQQEKPTISLLDHKIAIKAVTALKTDLAARNRASHLFDVERNDGLSSILGNIEQMTVCRFILMLKSGLRTYFTLLSKIVPLLMVTSALHA